MSVHDALALNTEETFAQLYKTTNFVIPVNTRRARELESSIIGDFLDTGTRDLA